MITIKDNFNVLRINRRYLISCVLNTYVYIRLTRIFDNQVLPVNQWCLCVVSPFNNLTEYLELGFFNVPSPLIDTELTAPQGHLELRIYTDSVNTYPVEPNWSLMDLVYEEPAYYNIDLSI